MHVCQIIRQPKEQRWMPPLILIRRGVSHAIPPDMLMHACTGIRGYVHWLDGRHDTGHVCKAVVCPLGRFPVGPPPSDRTPQQLAKRLEVGAELVRLGQEAREELAEEMRAFIRSCEGDQA